jgi:hypothetical protein
MLRFIPRRIVGKTQDAHTQIACHASAHLVTHAFLIQLGLLLHLAAHSLQHTLYLVRDALQSGASTLLACCSLSVKRASDWVKRNAALIISDVIDCLRLRGSGKVC